MKTKRMLCVVAVSLVVASGCGLWLVSRWERGADPDYDTHVAAPALVSERPRVLFDHGHHNAHSTSGRYRPFKALIESDGCRVRETESALTPELLRGADILVIVNAKGKRPNQDAAALTAVECDAVRDYVHAGGSLLLVADHHPCGEAAAALAGRFGVDMSGGWTDDEPSARPGSGDPGQILFSRENGGLADHPITRGAAGGRLDCVETFTGQSLRGPADAAPLLRLGPTAIDRVPVSSTVAQQGSKRVTTFETDDRPAAGRAQGLAFRFGRGRAVVLAEAAMLTAQRDEKGRLFGMNAPGNDNRTFTLNVIRWLAGALNE